ncbi:hypothetical protein [Clostridium sp.]|nr:hypothetical protein [Clostridium sp.]
MERKVEILIWKGYLEKFDSYEGMVTSFFKENDSRIEIFKAKWK